MKLLSVTFNLSKDDCNTAIKAISKKRKKVSLKKLLLIAIILSFCAIWIFLDMAYISLNLTVVFILPYILINLFAVYESKKAKNKILKRSTTVEFFEDKIEITDNPSKDYKGKFEKVFPYEQVSALLDFPEFLLITFKNSDTQLIMKKDLQEEQIKLISSKIKAYINKDN